VWQELLTLSLHRDNCETKIRCASVCEDAGPGNSVTRCPTPPPNNPKRRCEICMDRESNSDCDEAWLTAAHELRHCVQCCGRRFFRNDFKGSKNRNDMLIYMDNCYRCLCLEVEAYDTSYECNQNLRTPQQQIEDCLRRLARDACSDVCHEEFDYERRQLDRKAVENCRWTD
jgi:hypothetical protein